MTGQQLPVQVFSIYFPLNDHVFYLKMLDYFLLKAFRSAI